MNCYQKILQKNVYRTCAGNCKEIASVTTFHRNDKLLASVGLVIRLLLSFHSIAMTISGLSSRTQCGDLLAMRLLPPRHKCGSWQAHI